MSRIVKAFLTNEAAIKRLLGRYFKRRQDIDDVTQEVFLRAFAAETKRTILTPKAFLFQTARNIALNELKRKSTNAMEYVGDSGALDVLQEEGPNVVEGSLDARARLVILAKGIATLPPKCRRVFVLRKIYGYTHKEISEELKISPKTVEKHLTAGTLKCGVYVRTQGYDPVNFASGGFNSPTGDSEHRPSRGSPVPPPGGGDE